MSSSDVARSQRVLDKVGARLGLTEPGKQWLIAAVDPFHDTPLTVTGYPDVAEAASVVQIVKLSNTIAVPTGITGNWDCSIHQYPWQRVSNLAGGNWSNTVDGNQITGYGDFLLGADITTPTPIGLSSLLTGGLIVDRVASGTPFQCYLSTNSEALFDATLQPYLVGQYRIIGMGFEVINTTSELNVQGLCTVYRQPCDNIDSAKSVLMTQGLQSSGPNTTAVWGFPDVLNTNMPPSTTNEALLLDGSKQWKAKEGCYVVSTLNSDEIPSGPNTTVPVLHLSKSDPTSSNGTTWALQVPRVNPAGIWTQAQAVNPTTGTLTFGFFGTTNSQLQPFNHAGAIFSGLSNTTTLQVNATYYIERFPSQQDSALVVLARQSARNDCIAKDLYSEIIREMPVGVPQRMNGLGEWFADAVSSAVDYIAPVASAISPMLGGGLKIAGSVAKSLGTKKEAVGQTYSASGSNVQPSKPKVSAKTMVSIATTKKKKKNPMKK